MTQRSDTRRLSIDRHDVGANQDFSGRLAQER